MDTFTDEHRGAWVTIEGPESDTVSGWLIGEIAQGFLVAIDDELRDVRLVAKPYYLMKFQNNKVLPRLRYAGAIQDELKSVSSAISGPVRSAISRINFDRLHQFGHQSSELRSEIHRWERYRWPEHQRMERDKLMGYLAAQADRSTALHREVYDTLENSGLADVLDEFGPRLASLPSELTIPAYDLEFESRQELTSALEGTREDRWTASRHRASLDTAETIRTQFMAEATDRRKERSERRSGKPDDANSLSRWVGPSLRILAGTGLATANAAIGVTAGITGSIVTIGASAVPTYVGVITSIYTGLAQVADGLEKIGRSK